ncbi:MAG: PilZ domain-containing protein [Phycisphaeraceae bacterium]|nr:PilZ domain-containing protein [Phycisphaeraceae bacterium]
MPANRSRTLRFREQIEQIIQRRGGIEIGVVSAAKPDAIPAADLLWRVRILAASDSELLLEVPSAAGQQTPLPENVRLVGIMTIGQNRWVFESMTLGPGTVRDERGHTAPALRIRMPERVVRSPRRGFHRLDGGVLNLPNVECWPLLDPTSVIAAELANRAELERVSTGAPFTSGEGLLPDVGPRFGAHLLNISGGGVGLVVPPDDAPGLDRARFVWMRIDLRPRIAVPLGVTARQVHAHRDSAQNVQAGLSFEFQFNPPHRAFIVDQIVRLVQTLRQEQDTPHRAAA